MEQFLKTPSACSVHSYMYSVEFASVVSSTYSHDSSVTCLSWRDNILVSGSWDSTVKVSVKLHKVFIAVMI